MKSIVVIENAHRWPLKVEGAEVASARDYLTDPRFAEVKRAAVFNLCRQYGYQSLGYYVSLLAEARGHRPYPPVTTLRGIREDALVRIAGEELDDLIQKALAPLKGEEFVLSVYFGRNLAKRYDRLSRALFNQFPLPFLRAHFERVDEHERSAGNGGRREDSWRLIRIRPIATAEIPDAHRDFVIEQAGRFFSRAAPTSKAPATYRFDLAILWSPDDPLAASDKRAVRLFQKAFEEEDIGAEVIEAPDLGGLGRYDALFIRENTAVESHTYRFALRAAAEGLVVIDAPESITRCGNKVFQFEVFRRLGVAMPATLLVHEGNLGEVASAVGLPCVLKKPDGAFSQGVVKVSTPEELDLQLASLLDESSLVIAQAWTPSAFDWRIGVLGGKPLWAARYHMVPGHWQIARHGTTRTRYGDVEAVALADVPDGIVDLAVRAAEPMGTGLYGADIKQLESGEAVVMEVNDNPNVDAGCEDGVLGAELYREIARWFRARLEERGRKTGGAG